METLSIAVSIFVGVTVVLVWSIGRLVKVLKVHKGILEAMYQHSVERQNKVYNMPRTSNLDWQQILHNKQVPTKILTMTEYEKVKDDPRFLHNNSSKAKSIIGLYLGEKIKIKRANKKRN